MQGTVVQAARIIQHQLCVQKLAGLLPASLQHHCSAGAQCCHFTTSSSPASSSSSSSSSGPGAGLPLHLQDQVVLKGMAFYGYHGAKPEENVLGQRFLLDATVWTDLAASGRSDKLQDTLDYTQVYSVVQQVVEGPPKQLQEAVVEEVCQRLLQLDDRVTAVQVYMRKPHVAIHGILDSVGVQVFRQRHAGSS